MQNHWFCSNHILNLNQKHVCKPGFWKRPYWERFWERPYLEGYACKKCLAQKPVGQVSDVRSGANRLQTTTKNGNNHRNEPSRCWVRRGQGWAQQTVQLWTSKIQQKTRRQAGGFRMIWGTPMTLEYPNMTVILSKVLWQLVAFMFQPANQLKCFSSTNINHHKPPFTLWYINITMENHHFQWVNPLFLWPCSIAM